MSSGKIILARHGLTDWSVQGLRLGSSDIPLNAQGIEQAHRIGKALAYEAIAGIWHSNMQRTLETASIIAEHANHPPLQVDERLRERDHGKFEGTAREMRNGADTTSELSPEEAVANGVELGKHHWERTVAAYEAIRATCDGKTLIIVSHYGSIRMILAYVLGLGPEGRRQIEADCASLATILVSDTGDSVQSQNSTSHLE